MELPSSLFPCPNPFMTRTCELFPSTIIHLPVKSELFIALINIFLLPSKNSLKRWKRSSSCRQRKGPPVKSHTLRLLWQPCVTSAISFAFVHIKFEPAVLPLLASVNHSGYRQLVIYLARFLVHSPALLPELVFSADPCKA